MFGRRRNLAILAVVAAASSFVSALPLPHPQLSESEFRSFPDDMEEANHNKVVISSGYSNVGGRKKTALKHYRFERKHFGIFPSEIAS